MSILRCGIEIARSIGPVTRFCITVSLLCTPGMLDESFTELPTNRGVFDRLAGKGYVLPCLENLFSSFERQHPVHLIARKYCRKNFGNFCGLSQKNLLTDVSKKVHINCLWKEGGSGADIPEIIFVIQLLEEIIEIIPMRLFIRHSEFAALFKIFVPRVLNIPYDIDHVGEEGDEADPFDVGSPSASDAEKSEKIHSSSVPR